MFGNTTRHLAWVRNYTEATAVFNKRGAVRSKKWAENERPLYKTYHHYRLVKHPEYYDVVLYHTVMARYYEPTIVDGKKHERRLYMGDNSVTSRDFMYHVLGVSRSHTTELADGTMVVAPIYNRSSLHNDGESFSADFIFVDGFLDPAQSVHTPHHKMVSGNDDKTARAEILKRFDNFIMLAQMRLPEFVASAELSRGKGRPWGNGMQIYHYREAVEAIAHHDSPPQSMVDDFFAMCQDAVNVLASKRAYAQENFTLAYSWHSNNPNNDSIDKLDKPITAEDLRKAVSTRILKALDLDKKSVKQTIPQFVVEKDYPRSNVHW